MLNVFAYFLNQDDLWNGLTILNPFNYPNVAISVVIDGVHSLKLSGPTYPLEVASGLDEVKDDFTFILGQVVFDENDLFSGETIKNLQFETLNPKDDSVLEFLKDVGVLRDLKQKVILCCL